MQIPVTYLYDFIIRMTSHPLPVKRLIVVELGIKKYPALLVKSNAKTNEAVIHKVVRLTANPLGRKITTESAAFAQFADYV